jgi:hypothetical protein
VIRPKPETHGAHYTAKGYLRFHVPPFRNRYVHRVQMAVLCREFCYYELMPDGLPFGLTVEHLDHNRSHNCVDNLILLDTRIHSHISWDSFKDHR